MKEAVAKMKAELGDDAVILHTKKYKEGGLLGLGSKEMVEITAAIEDEKPIPKQEPEIEIPQRTTPMMPTSVLSQYKTNGTAEGVAMAERELTPPSRTSSPTTTDEDSPSMMSPTVNQASSLEAAMKPNQRSSRPDSPMPYEKEETSPTPYELDISSRSDLNVPKTENSTQNEMQNSESNFIQTGSSELSESDIDNEHDESVYMAEPENSIPTNETSNSQLQSASTVQAYNNTSNMNTMANADISTDTAQISTEQNNISQSVPQSQSSINTTSPSNPQIPQEQQMPQYQNQPQAPTSNQMPQQAGISNVTDPAPLNQNTQQVQQPQPVQQPQQIQYPQQIQQPQQLQNPQQVANAQQPAAQNLSTQPVQSSAQQTSTAQNSMDQTSSNTNQQQMDVNQPLTPAQLAQAQAMMMAQFNQMQMAQAMQQAMAQVQAQAQEQVRQAYLQSQQQLQEQSNVHVKNTVKPAKEGETQTNDDGSQDKIKKLENEIAQMKALLAQVMGKDGKQGSLTLHEALKKQEVNENILNDMAAHSEAGDTLVDSQSREAKSTLVKFLNENINFSEGIKLNRHGVRIAALLGTTGVGKTTTLAKIAAKFVLEQGITAALITADTYRISAVEQLRTYSDILGLPLEIVYSPAELSKAINKYRNRDLILIDTAGRSQHNEYQMKELQEFLRANQRIEKHIVLSTTTKSSDANDILEKFSVCEPDKIIFTKTDETASVGLIVNLLCKQKLSISYLTNGQSVPDDITPASAEVLADLLLRRNV